jgi:hypothetical protein
MGRHEVPEKIPSQYRSNDLFDGCDSDAVLVGVKIDVGVRDSVVFRVYPAIALG